MSLSRLIFRPAALTMASLALAALASAGCRPADEIARYTVPKPELVDPTLVKAAAEERQMLGAIVLVNRAGWFFKLTGAKEQVTPLAEPFLTFVKSVKFEGSRPEPKWTVPPGWKELPGNESRFATLEIPAGGKALELTVTRLELGDFTEDEYILSNINRWRGQLGLGELRASDLATETVTAKVGDHPATFINIVGTGSGQMAGPFAGGPPQSTTSAGRDAGPSTLSASPSSAPVKWTKPEGWKEIPPKTFGIAAFTVDQAPKQVEVTLSSAGGDWTANVNRWRGQVGLPPQQADEIAKEAKQIEVLGTLGNYVELTGSSEKYGPTSLLGIAVTVDGTQYFVKLIGNAELAESEKANFESFARSLKLE